MSIVFPFDKALVEKNPLLYQYIQNSSVEKFVAYLLHSDYRDAVALEPWIKEQVNNPTIAVREFADSIPVGADDDETALNVLYKVIHSIKYVQDGQRWKMPEYWSTADETLTATTMNNGVTYLPMEGDCEDGAILCYVLCRLKGIKPEKLLLFAGDVEGGGHCWLGYRPLCYPLNWVFLDWCYWPTEKGIGARNFYYIRDTDVFGETTSGLIDNRYISVWFGFNEEHSVLKMSYIINK